MQRSKLQEACKKSFSGALFDAATGAPFGHQLQLSLAESAHFDPVKRSLALAIAGRSAGVETAGAYMPSSTPQAGALSSKSSIRSAIFALEPHGEPFRRRSRDQQH